MRNDYKIKYYIYLIKDKSFERYVFSENDESLKYIYAILSEFDINFNIVRIFNSIKNEFYVNNDINLCNKIIKIAYSNHSIYVFKKIIKYFFNKSYYNKKVMMSIIIFCKDKFKNMIIDGVYIDFLKKEKKKYFKYFEESPYESSKMFYKFYKTFIENNDK